MAYTFRWIITKDHISAKDETILHSRRGIGKAIDLKVALTRVALVRADDEDGDKIDAIAKAMAHEIRLLDDDGEVYFEGASNDINQSEGRSFAPLDWAMDDAGCTELQYRPMGSDAKWETL